MHKIILTVILAVLTSLSLCHSQRNTINYPTLPRYVEQIIDPITGMEWRSVNLNVITVRDTRYFSSRECASLNFILNRYPDGNEFYLRYIMRASLEQWPVDEDAYLVLDKTVYEILLEDVSTDPNVIRNETPPLSMMESPEPPLNTQSFQLFRKVADLSSIMNEVRKANRIRLITYAGKRPFIFELSPNQILKVRSILH